MAEGISYEQAVALLKENNAQILGGIKTPTAGGGAGAGSGAGSAISSLIPSFSGLNGVVVNTTGAFTNLWKGTVTASSALNSLGDVIGKIPGIGPALAALTTSVGGAVVSTNDNLNQAAKSGANFNNNLVAYDNLVKGARLTQEQYNDIVKTNASSLSGLGSNINRAQTNFLTFTKELQESPEAIQQLKALGMSADEVATVGITALANERNINMNDAKTRTAVVNASIRMAEEMENVTRLTGKSREAQMADIKARSENVVVQAAVMQMGADGMLKYKEMQGKLEGMGKGVQDVADELFTGGIRTKEGAAKFAALGPAGADLEKAVLMQKNATTEKQKIEAAEAMAKAKAAIDDYQRSKAYLDQVQYGTGAASDAARQMMKENLEAKSTAQARREAEEKSGGKPVSTVDVQAAQKAEVEGARKGLDAEGKKMQDQPGRDAAIALNNVNRASKDLAAGMSLHFGSLIKETDNLTQRFGGLAGLANKVPPMTQEQAGDVGRKQVAKMIDDAREKLAPKEKETRDTGTLGMTGQLFEPKDFFGKVQQGETVLTPSQLTNLVQGAAAQGMPDINGLLSKLNGKNAGAPDEEKIKADMLKSETSRLSKMPRLEEMLGKSSSMMGDVTSKFSQMKIPDATKSSKDDMMSQLTQIKGMDVSSISASLKDMPVTNAADAASKAAETAKKAQATQSDKPTAPKVPTKEDVTMKDLHEDLVQLNKMMSQLVSHSAESVDATHKVARATKNAGNRLMPA